MVTGNIDDAICPNCGAGVFKVVYDEHVMFCIRASKGRSNRSERILEYE